MRHQRLGHQNGIVEPAIVLAHDPWERRHTIRATNLEVHQRELLLRHSSAAGRHPLCAGYDFLERRTKQLEQLVGIARKGAVLPKRRVLKHSANGDRHEGVECVQTNAPARGVFFDTIECFAEQEVGMLKVPAEVSDESVQEVPSEVVIEVSCRLLRKPAA